MLDKLRKTILLGIIIINLVLLGGCIESEEETKFTENIEPVDEIEPKDVEPTENIKFIEEVESTEKIEECYDEIDVNLGNPSALFCKCMGGEIVDETCEIGSYTYNLWEYFNEKNPYDNSYSPSPKGYDEWINFCTTNKDSVYCKVLRG